VIRCERTNGQRCRIDPRWITWIDETVKKTADGDRYYCEVHMASGGEFWSLFVVGSITQFDGEVGDEAESSATQLSR
jgi:hypothetical protein